MTLSMFGYVVNDAFIKRATEDIPLFQAIFLRGLLATAVLAVIVRAQGVAVPPRRYLQRPLLLRMAMEAVGTVTYLLALTKVPIAGLTAVMQLVPIAVTFAAARLLRERVDLHRVAAIAFGFLGVMLVVRPGSDDFSPWFLVGLIAVVGLVVRELATRQISNDMAGPAIALGTSVVITTMGGIVSIVQGWDRPTTTAALFLGAASFFLSLAYVASVVTVRLGDISFTAPFRYTVLVFAIVLQIVVFNDVPDALTFAGSAVVAAAGLYALQHERRLATRTGQS